MCKDQVTILLADDDPDDQYLLKEAIVLVEPAVYVKVFNNGLELVNYLDGAQYMPPCLIVLDYNMPFVNGLQVLEKIVSDSQLRSIPTIVWSTSNSSLYENQCLTTGALKYIVKPDNSRAFKEIAIQMVDACCGDS